MFVTTVALMLLLNSCESPDGTNGHHSSRVLLLPSELPRFVFPEDSLVLGLNLVLRQSGDKLLVNAREQAEPLIQEELPFSSSPFFITKSGLVPATLSEWQQAQAVQEVMGVETQAGPREWMVYGKKLTFTVAGAELRFNFGNFKPVISMGGSLGTQNVRNMAETRVSVFIYKQSAVVLIAFTNSDIRQYMVLTELPQEGRQ